ncbi:sushi domain protein, partial [Ancylostoma caninum]
PGDCPFPNIPGGIIVDYQGPYTDGVTINGRCQGNGYIMGPSSMTCLFGNWVPPFLGQCSNGLQYSCPTPHAPQGAHLSSQGPFGNGDMVRAICDDGGYILGPSSMACVMGHWAPAFFGDCTSSQRYSCQVPPPKPGMSLSRQGTVRSDDTVTATCTENMKVLIGIKSMTCVFGHWAPNQFGDCVDVNQLGTVVYSDGSGLVIVKYRNGTEIKDLGNGELLIQYSSGESPDTTCSSVQHEEFSMNSCALQVDTESSRLEDMQGYQKIRLNETHNVFRKRRIQVEHPKRHDLQGWRANPQLWT